MKTNLTINKKQFTKAFTLGSSFSKKNVSHALLELVKIDIRKSDIIFTSTDTQSCIKTRMPHGNECEPCEPFCVSHRDLQSYIKLIPSDVFELSVSDDLKYITVSHLSGQFDIAVSPAENFPVFDFSLPDNSLSVDSNLIYKFIQDGKDFAADDELRPVMNCMFIYVKDGRIGYCVSDGYTMIADEYDYVKECSAIDFMINKLAFPQIMNLCSDETGDIIIGANDKNVIVKGKNTFIAFRSTEGRYPNFNSVIPKNNHIVANISKTSVAQAIQRASVSTCQASHLIKMNFTRDTLEICGEDVGFGRKGTEKVSVTCNENILIGFKDSFFIKCLNALSDENVQLNMSDNSRAATFGCEGEPNKRILLMPLMLD